VLDCLGGGRAAPSADHELGNSPSLTVLSPAERAVVISRLQADQQFSAAGEEFRWTQVAKASVDPKMWLGMLAYAAIDVPLYAFA
jgi:hypothetical protein